jgi:hypothetical protein
MSALQQLSWLHIALTFSKVGRKKYFVVILVIPVMKLRFGYDADV